MIKLVSILFLCALVPCVFSQWRSIHNVFGKAIHVTSKGAEVWSLSDKKQVYRLNPKTNSWVLQPGDNVAHLSASSDGWAWAINIHDAIYRFNINTREFERIPGVLSQVSAITKDSAIGVNRQQNIYLYQNDEFVQLPGNAVYVCIGEEDERWAINHQQNIYRWNHDIDNWIHIPGSAVQIACQGPNAVVITNKDGQMYYYKENDWHLIPSTTQNHAVKVTVGTNAAYCLTRGGDVYSAKFAFLGNGAAAAPAAAAAAPAKAAAAAPAAAAAAPANDKKKQAAPAAGGRDQFDFDVPTVQNVDNELDDNFNVVVNNQ